jgi:glycosyltransferase involved in cell wall biosynthesis
MKIAYITNTTYVSGWANSVQIVNMCKSFSKVGADVTLVLPYRSVQKDIDLFEYYHIPKTFKVKMLPCIDLSIGNEHPIFYWLRLISFYISARFYVWFNNFDYLYSRDLYSALFFPKIIIEQHSFPKKIKFPLNFVFNKKRKVVCLTSFIKDLFVKAGILSANTVVAPSAVDLEEFSEKKPKIIIDGTKEGDFVFGYIGTLKTMNMEKGVSDCLESLKFLDGGYKFLVVGGEEDDLEYYKKMSEDLNIQDKVIFVGKVSYSEVSKYSSFCDVFVAPYPENEHYSFFMSPLKIFEYMASRKPIITTSLPSIKEVLKDGENAILVEPSNPKQLAESIIRLKNNPELGAKLAEKAFQDVKEKYTWDNRARKILDFIKK